MVGSISSMFITGANVVRSVTGEEYTNQELGDAAVHGTVSGVAHRQFANGKDCFRCLRDLVEILPSSCAGTTGAETGFLHQNMPKIESILPAEPQIPY